MRRSRRKKASQEIDWLFFDFGSAINSSAINRPEAGLAERETVRE